jgi:hypothetical protein
VLKGTRVAPRACLSALALCLLSSACNKPHAIEARKKIRLEHGPRVAQIVLEDLTRHAAGLRHAADRIAAGFVKVQGEQQEREVRLVLKLLRSPKKGVQELVISPLSFIAAVDKNGIVIARDSEPDHMKGMNLATMFPTVTAALAGKEGYEIGEFASLEPGGKPSVTIVLAAPSHYGNEVVGALVLGIPLWRLEQRLSKQLQMEEAGKKQGVVIWVYLYRGDDVHSHGTPRDLDQIVPDAKARRAGLARSPGGFTGEVPQYGYWYGYGVRPIRVLGDGVGVVVFRMEPQ